MTKKTTLRIIYNSCVLLLLLAGAWLVINHFMHFGSGEFTDNATVQQHITPVNTRVQGFIKEIRFSEYQTVHRGDTLVLIEDSEYQLQLAQAEAALQRELAGTDATMSGISATKQTIGAGEASIDEARAQLDEAQREEQRYAQLLKDDAVTRQQYDRMHTALLAARARYTQAVRRRATLTGTEQEQGHRLTQNHATVEAARAAVRLARLRLSYTAIIATADGVMGRKDIHEGQLVQPGQALASIVDNTELWVTANFRETQLPGIALGAEVEVKADAVPGVIYKGTVERISDATGAAMSLIPQDNATGNFVKVEQRVPVRIRLSDSKQLKALRAGMNVECEVKPTRQ